MEVQFGPNSVDEPNLLYKLQCKVKVFNTVDTLPNRGYNLVASSSKYGLVFVGVPSGSLSVYQLHQLINKEPEPPHLSVNLPEKPTHVSVSCDYELLAVTGRTILCIYKVTDFQNLNVEPVLSIKYELSSPTYVSAMQWNPCIPDSIALAFYDGTLYACQVGTRQVKNVPSKARCICWSPKGKQLVTGNSDGSLHQFKPDLTPAKAIPAPNLFEGAPVEALAVYWISTFQFAVVYKNAADNSRPSVTIVNTPKGGQPSCLNYEDFCYSMGSVRPWYYFLHGTAQWNMILSASSNSMELATIGSSDGVNWLQWCQPDEARPELPLTDKKQENYPVGVCIDLCAIHQLPWGENEVLPHMPLLHVVSQTGLLTIFNVVNLNKQAPQICSPPQLLNLPAGGLSSHIPGEVPKEAASIPETKPQSVPAATPSNANVPSAAPIKVPSFTPSAMPTATQPSADRPATVTQPKPQPIPPEPRHPSQPQPSQTHPSQPPPTQQPSQQSSQPLPNQPPPNQPPPSQPPPSQPPENAALKAEQERKNKAKANQELKNMLVKEVNDFQNDLYNFMLKTRETQARIQRDIESINSNFNFNSLDTEELKKECSIDELRNAVVQLKLELVRACAVIAEARTHSNAKEYHKWSQADPLTAKRVASVEKMAYYVQTQLDQAQEALAYRWSKRDETNRPGKHMIRPILDDVYQPLVTQQEILSRQQAVLRTLRKTLNECDIGPVFKSSSLLRNTPFKNKDPLSKLTKNILNMSIEPQNAKLSKGLLTVQKLEALKDALSNRKTVKIKPVNVELRQHFVSMKEKYERIVREKIAQSQVMSDMQGNEQVQPETQTQVPEYKDGTFQANTQPKTEYIDPVKQEVKNSASAPAQSTTPSGKPAQPGVVRNLFTDGAPNQANAAPNTEPMKQEVKQSTSLPAQNIFTAGKPGQPSVIRNLFTEGSPQVSPFSMFSGNIPAGAAHDSSVLKNLLQASAQANQAGTNAKIDANNLFMGQKICSPTGFSVPTTTTPSFVFSSKPPTKTTTFKPAPTYTENQPPTSKPASESSQKQQQTFKTASPFGGNQQPLFKPATTSNENQPPTPKPPGLSENQQQTFKPTPFGQNQTSSFKTPPAFAENQTTFKPATFGENQPPTSKPPATSENQPPTFADNKPAKIHSETGEPETAEPPKETKPTKPMTNLFGMKPSATSTPVPDVLKSSNIQDNVKPVDRQKKENVPKSEEAKDQKTDKKEVKPLGAQAVNKGFSFGSAANNSSPSNESKPMDLKAKSKADEKTEKNKTAEPKLTPAATAPKPVFSAAPTPKDPTPPKESTPPKEPPKESQESTPKSESDKPAETKSPAASLFGAAATSQSKSDLFSQNTSIFTTTNPQSVFGAKSAPGLTSFGQTSTTQSSTSVSSSGSDAKTDTETIPTTSSTSVFGSTPTTTSASFATTPSVFGQATAFAPTTTSLFTGTSSTFTRFGATQASVFEATSTASSVFGTANQAFGTTTTQAGSIFGAPTTQASVFGSTTPAQSVFGTAQVTQASLFGGTQTTQASVFGTAQTSQPSVFGTQAPTTQASVFGTPTQTTQASLFGTPTQTTQASIFGTPTQTTQASVFGTPTPTTQASVFGSPTQTTQASVFGTPTQTTQASVFGTPTQTTQASVFGTPTQTTQASVFGTPTQTTQASVFGTPTQTTQASVFGTPTQTTQASVFGTPTQTTQASVFGSTTSQPSVFGSASNSGGSLFGGGEANLFAAASISTTTANGTGGNIFGGSSNTSVFGGGNNVFGKTTFGQSNNAAANIFGGAAGFGQQKPASNLWAGGSTTGFGSTAFGQQTTQASSIFGGGTGSFSAPSAGAFGSPQQTPGFGNTESQPTSVFGSPQQAAGFGGSPVFGSKPAFGQPAGFGSPTSGGGFGGFGGGFNKSPSGFGAPAAFGNSATFGGSAFGSTSPGKVFGGAPAGFGASAQQSNATFENLATQNTLTFGSLAQSPQQQQQPTFNTSPSFTGWRG